MKVRGAARCLVVVVVVVGAADDDEEGTRSFVTVSRRRKRGARSVVRGWLLKWGKKGVVKMERVGAGL